MLLKRNEALVFLDIFKRYNQILTPQTNFMTF